MADRRLLEDGSRRLQEDGSYRLLEQQSTIGVTASITEADDTLVASLALEQTGGVPLDLRRRRALQYDVYRSPVPPPAPRELAFSLREDDDRAGVMIEVIAGRRVVQRRRALVMLLIP